jgi:hypothetical protein
LSSKLLFLQKMKPVSSFFLAASDPQTTSKSGQIWAHATPGHEGKCPLSVENPDACLPDHGPALADATGLARVPQTSSVHSFISFSTTAKANPVLSAFTVLHHGPEQKIQGTH